LPLHSGIGGQEGFVVEPTDEDPGSPLYWQKLFAEASAPYESEPEQSTSLDTLRSLYSTVLANYEHRCAMTGVHYPPSGAFLHESLEIAPIRPLPSGGLLHVSNFLCLERRVVEAFRLGHIAVGPRLELVVDLSRFDPELLERLNPLGRLGLPKASVGQPDPAALAFHREHIFLR
jgi:hypothetical protein